MRLTGFKPDSKYTVIALQEIILPRVKHLVILEEREIILVASVSSVTHRNSGKQMSDFMLHFPYVYFPYPVFHLNYPLILAW